MIFILVRRMKIKFIHCTQKLKYVKITSSNTGLNTTDYLKSYTSPFLRCSKHKKQDKHVKVKTIAEGIQSYIQSAFKRNKFQTKRHMNSISMLLHIFIYLNIFLKTVVQIHEENFNKII